MFLNQPTIYWIAQLVGVGSLISYIVAFQVKNNTRLYLAQTVGGFIMAIHLFLLGAISGVALQFVSMGEFLLLFLAKKYPKLKNKIFLVLFIAGHIAITVIYWDGLLAGLAFVASFVTMLAMWSNNARLIRVANLFVILPVWLVYNFLIRSIPGVAMEIISMISVIVSIVRFGWKNLGDPNSEFQN
ncbi:MAG: YgjV family protein [Lachnospiraceae bacterium]|nr:YgjV family protein [Lachnospiraceae bacterium]